jgi:glycosyltransferase involved in cell wall biosynthesis
MRYRDTIGTQPGKSSICCVIPAKNEAGYLNELFIEILSVHELGEIIIVEGGSQDETWKICEALADSNSGRVRAVKQSKTGKFNAVLEGAELSSSDLILIWDADGTVAKQDVIRVINLALQTNSPVMGNRLLGEMEPGSMKVANKIGNWIFALLWSPLLFQKPVDLLCGTKIFPKKVLVDLPEWLRNIDPYGDFALIAHSRKLGYKVQSLQVDYFARKYGASNIHRWSGGLRLGFCTVAMSIWLASPMKSNQRRHDG